MCVYECVRRIIQNWEFIHFVWMPSQVGLSVNEAGQGKIGGLMKIHIMLKWQIFRIIQFIFCEMPYLDISEDIN